MDGFFIVDKPKGMTSQTVCNKIKYKFNLNKVGHSGTLDPNTTGVLVVAVNKATKLLKLINEHDKEYIATIIFGYETDTLDMDGKIIKEIDMKVNLDDIKKCVNELAKKTQQIPPLTSAIKVNGKKLYEYQRKGIDVEVKERNIKIYSSEILSDLRYIDNHYEIDIKLNVSKGFYVRSYARDLGIMLNGNAVLKELRRTKAGEFCVENSVSLDELREEDCISIFKQFDFPKVEVNDYLKNLVLNGVTLDERQTTINQVFYVTNKCDIIAIYEPVDEKKYKPVLIFK